jgi:hypothetical protein
MPKSLSMSVPEEYGRLGGGRNGRARGLREANMKLGFLRASTRGMIAVAVATGCVVVATADVASAAPADVDVTYDCDAGTVTVTSNKNISNIVVSVDGVHTKTPDLTGLTYVFGLESLEGLDSVWVKSGNNQSGDGPGYGERFDFDIDCDPDSDGDGFPESTDCNDADPLINPDAVDIPNNGIDENCDGADLIVGDGKIRVTVTWGNDDDLDLYVIDPNGATVWYLNHTVPSGGTLDRDDNVNQCGADPEPGGVENIIWPTLDLPGVYTVELRAYNGCTAGTPTPYTIQVFVDSALVTTRTGTSDLSGNAIVDTFTFTVT